MLRFSGLTQNLEVKADLIFNDRYFIRSAYEATLYGMIFRSVVARSTATDLKIISVAHIKNTVLIEVVVDLYGSILKIPLK